jgi:hypothetical protein
MTLRDRANKALRAARWRAKVRHWRRTRFPRTWRQCLNDQLLIGGMHVWRVAWLHPLHALYLAEVISRDQFEQAAMGPLRRK